MTTIKASKTTSLVSAAIAALALASSSGAVAFIGLTGAVASDAGHIAKVSYGWRSHCQWRWGHRHCYPHWGHYRPWGHHWSQQHGWGPRHSWRS